MSYSPKGYLVTPKEEPGVNNWLETRWTRTFRSTYRRQASMLSTHPSSAATRETGLERLSILHLGHCFIFSEMGIKYAHEQPLLVVSVVGPIVGGIAIDKKYPRSPSSPNPDAKLNIFCEQCGHAKNQAMGALIQYQRLPYPNQSPQLTPCLSLVMTLVES